MKLSDQQFIPAAPAAVYAALNDARILQQCIPGCRQLEKKSDTEMTATVELKMGPVKAVFNGEVSLSNLNPPHGYTISGQGSGGTAGFAKGSAAVRLQAHEDGTNLTYEVEAQISGKIAQLGARLVDATAKKLAAQFFAKFAECLAPQDAAAEQNESAQAAKGKAGENLLRSNPAVTAALLLLTAVLAVAGVFLLI